METTHRIYMQNADRMDSLDAESVDLVVTSPPYPMIQMWDQMFGRLDPQINADLDWPRSHEGTKKTIVN